MSYYTFVTLIHLASKLDILRQCYGYESYEYIMKKTVKFPKLRLDESTEGEVVNILKREIWHKRTTERG